MSEVGPAIDVPALFGYNLMHDQPLHKVKQHGNQRMNAVCNNCKLSAIRLPCLGKGRT